MRLFKLAQEGDLLRIGFGEPATNAEILRELEAAAKSGELKFVGGARLLVDGPASLPVAVWLSHMVGHLYGFVAVRDPKLGEGRYVVAVSHSPDHKVGDVVTA